MSTRMDHANAIIVIARRSGGALVVHHRKSNEASASRYESSNDGIYHDIQADNFCLPSINPSHKER